MTNQILKSGTPEYDKYVEEGYQRHLANQARFLEGIKERYKALCIQWTPEIEKEALRLSGAGITQYLRGISKQCEIARLEANPDWGTW